MSEYVTAELMDDDMGEHDAVPPLASLVASRLCHDLSGLLGTLLGALEMTIDETPKPGEALLLADDAARELSLRLRLLRAAWAGDGTVLDAAGIAALVPGLASGRRVRVDVDGLVGAFPSPVGRAVLNLVLLGAEALPGGGGVTLRGRWPGGIAMRAEGPRLARPASLAQGLAGLTLPPAGPRGLQVPMTFLAAGSAGAVLSAPEDGDGLTLTLSPAG